MICYKAFSKSVWFVLCFSLCVYFVPSNALAAEYPIEKDGAGYDELIGYGRSINGTIYVPLRLLFEVAEAEVNWEAANSTITINRCDGIVITLQVGKKQAKIVSADEERQVTMPTAPRMLGDTVYVPLRFAAENLLCSLEWDNAAKKVLLQKQFVVLRDETNSKRYIVDFAGGKLYEQMANGEINYLGQSADITNFCKAEVGNGWDKTWFAPVVVNIKDGCLLIDVCMDTVDSQMWTFWRLLISPDGTNNRSFVCKISSTRGNLYNFYYDGTSIWWPEKEQVLQLDSKTGETLASYTYQQLLADLPIAQNYGFAFADGQYMLLTYQKPETYYSNFPILVNLQTGELRDVFSELIPSEEQAKFCYDGASPSSSLRFVRSENGMLYFNYQTWSNMKMQERELSFQYR